jgi:hypothetical protein
MLDGDGGLVDAIGSETATCHINGMPSGTASDVQNLPTFQHGPAPFDERDNLFAGPNLHFAGIQLIVKTRHR